jgi:hypothetical protein
MKKAPVELQTLLCFACAPEGNKQIYILQSLFQLRFLSNCVLVCMHIHKYLPEESSTSERERDKYISFRVKSTKNKASTSQFVCCRPGKRQTLINYNIKCVCLRAEFFLPSVDALKSLSARYFTAL